MTEPSTYSRPWLPMAVLVAMVYPAVGIAFAAFGNPSSSHQAVIAWRLAAWIVSAAAFLLHLWHEHFRLFNPPLRAAVHVSVAVALGAFVLAAWVNLHGHWAPPGRQNPLAPAALLLFPAITGVPAFIAAFVGGALLVRIHPPRQ